VIKYGVLQKGNWYAWVRVLAQLVVDSIEDATDAFCASDGNGMAFSAPLTSRFTSALIPVTFHLIHP
jgi:hypothetical protein